MHVRVNTEKCQLALVISDGPSVLLFCYSVCIAAAPTGRISVNFDTGGDFLYESIERKNTAETLKSGKNITRITPRRKYGHTVNHLKMKLVSLICKDSVRTAQ